LIFSNLYKRFADLIRKLFLEKLSKKHYESWAGQHHHRVVEVQEVKGPMMVHQEMVHQEMVHQEMDPHMMVRPMMGLHNNILPPDS
jgi:hypothetical protein